MLNNFARQIANALDLPAVPSIDVLGSESLPSYFAVSDLACASIGMATAMVADWRALKTATAETITIDRRLASKWFDMTIRPQGWVLPNIWDPLAGDYETRDGWIRLHTNATHHRKAALAVLGKHETREDLRPVVQAWNALELEEAIVSANGCAATMRSRSAWQSHAQGKAVAREPIIDWKLHGTTTLKTPAINPARPLSGVRVLDLTRVLAGPVAGRFLAAYGADVLRIDPPGWDEGAVIPEVTLGKRCAGLDLRNTEDRKIFEDLIAGADILLHGYRPDALPDLGYDSKALRAINPTLIDVTLSAYGWTGPWAKRRGFDSLVQMSCGIAAWGQQHANAIKPVALPVQALDHATGYLMAASAVRAMILRTQTGKITTARHSLARTAHILDQSASPKLQGRFAAETPADSDPTYESTSWGPARRIRFPATISGISHAWHHRAGALRRDDATWTKD